MTSSSSASRGLSSLEPFVQQTAISDSFNTTTGTKKNYSWMLWKDTLNQHLPHRSHILEMEWPPSSSSSSHVWTNSSINKKGRRVELLKSSGVSSSSTCFLTFLREEYICKNFFRRFRTPVQSDPFLFVSPKIVQMNFPTEIFPVDVSVQLALATQQFFGQNSFLIQTCVGPNGIQRT